MQKYGFVQWPIYHLTVCLLLKWLQRMNAVAIIEIPLCNKTVNVSCQKSIWSKEAIIVKLHDPSFVILLLEYITTLYSFCSYVLALIYMHSFGLHYVIIEKFLGRRSGKSMLIIMIKVKGKEFCKSTCNIQCENSSTFSIENKETSSSGETC